MSTKLKLDYQQPTHVLEPRHINSALGSMTDADQAIVYRQARILVNGVYDAPGIRNMDNGIALEVLTRVGALLG